MVQSGGLAGAFANMPFVGTAPIVESGSNANGNYVKFANGTMICYKNDSMSYTCTESVGAIYRTPTNKSFDFPVEFYTLPTVVPANIGSLSAWIGQVTISTSSVSFRGMGAVASSTVTYGFIAIGRWK